MIHEIPYSLRGENWTIRLIDLETYQGIYGKCSDSMCYTPSKYLDFCIEVYKPSLVRHEVTHAYVDINAYILEDLSSDDIEEQWCRFNERNLDQYLDDCQNIQQLIASSGIIKTP